MGNIQIQSKLKNKSLQFFIIFLITLTFVFRDLFTNFTTNLLDWLDYPYIIWVMYQNITHIKALDFVNFFNTNAFYPHQNTMFFSDLLLPQSLIALPFTFFTDNPILVFNIVFLITYILNYSASFLFFKQITEKCFIAFLGSLLIVFGPIFYLNLGHFQMQSYWAFLLSLYFLFRYFKNESLKNLLFCGVFLVIQFLASVYLAIFLLTTITILFLVRIVFNKDLLNELKTFLIILAEFFALAGIFIRGYLDTKQIYNIQRDFGEYITYSAHLSDYLFTNHINSVLHSSFFVNIWNSFNKHLGTTFPGFLLISSFLLYIFRVRKTRSSLQIAANLNKEEVFFLVLLLTGLLFSFGPRASFNGFYSEIPLPYTIILKLVPLIDGVRATTRWSFLFYFGLVYFFTKFTSSKKSSLLILIFAIFLIEYLPVNISTSQENYIQASDQILKEECEEGKKVVLEIPVTHFEGKGDIAQKLSYVTKNQLASIYHNCYLVNGYSGYDMPKLLEYDRNIAKLVNSYDDEELIRFLLENNINYFVFNSYRYNDIEIVANFESVLNNNPNILNLGKSVYRIEK